ncbi:MAG: EAL domain-containing protein [Gammaproteobacteria bacterium]|nr:EAL domain-containing protein [Gammaproteobacteria bacterium]
MKYQKKFTELVNSSPFPLVVIDNQCNVLYQNKHAQSLFGDKEANIKHFIAPHRSDEAIELKSIKAERVYERRLIINNQEHPYKLCFFKSMQHQEQCYYIWFIDNSVHENHDRKMAELAFIDTLTQCFNRTYLNTVLRLDDEIETDMTVFYLDLDKFKAVNDTYGHNAGDEVLRQVAERIRLSSRRHDRVLRLGGDEFCILFFELLPDAESIAHKLYDALIKPIFSSFGELEVGCSIGISAANKQTSTLSKLLSHADQAMFKAKKSKLHHVFRYDNSQQEELETYSFVSDLKNAFKDELIYCVYQPVYDSELSVVSLEVLARWYHPKLGAISPAKFIPLLEKHGLSVQFDKYILKKAVTLSSRMRQKFSKSLPLQVNVSANIEELSSLTSQLNTYVAQADIDKSDIIIEITEGKIYSDKALSIIDKLSAEGLKVYMDDFGTSYSNLKNLLKSSVTVIKFDRSLITNLSQPDFTKHLVAACKSIDKQILFEGVETKADAVFAKECRADLLQGFYFSKPLTEEQLVGELLPSITF